MKHIFLSAALMLSFLSCRPSPRAAELVQGRILFLGDSITQDGRYVSIIEYELFKAFPHADIDVISVGLSSETVSGLTEPGHPYPRPNLHDRLERALVKVKPQTVFTCYGMNDGIYFPQSDERFQAYKDGIQRLISAVRAAGAKLILLTPPMFDAQVIADKTVGLDAAQFGYASPYKGYNDVLKEYAEWLQSLRIDGVQVIDLNGPMVAYTQKQRLKNPDFALSNDGVHPQLVGHALMAQQVLKGIGVPIEELDPAALAAHLEHDALFQRVQDRRSMRSTAWLVDIGFTMPVHFEALQVAEAEQRAAGEKAEILAMLNR
jgi:lysophospholipase L1-like esterase